METIRVVIADDEPLYRERVTTALASERGVSIVGTAADGAEAMGMIRALKPDVAILDTEMPRLGGLEVAARCGPASASADGAPVIIFLSGHSNHAVSAFDLRAVDYILKPFEQARLGQSLERARTRLGNVHVDKARESLMALIDGKTKPRSASRGHIAVKSSGRFHFVRVDDIEWIEPVGNYVKLHTAEDSFVVKETLSRMIDRLGSDDFCQVHRSRAVNIHNIRHITARSRAGQTVSLLSGTCVPLSKTYRDHLESSLRRTFAALGTNLMPGDLIAED